MRTTTTIPRLLPLHRPLLPHTSPRTLLNRPSPRRYKHTTPSSSPSSSSTATEFARNADPTSTTIPGPSWLWLEPAIQPFRAYGAAQRRRPYLVQWLSAITIYYLGDLSAQRVMREPSQSPSQGGGGKGGEKHDPGGWYDTGRALRSLTIGAISSIPAYRWFLWLGESFNYTSKAVSLAVKVGVNQVVFTPLFNTYFFGMQSLLSGQSLGEAWQRVKGTVPVSWVNSCKVWPAITAVSFAVVPVEFRSIFAGVIAIGWQTYLSMLNQRAAKAELEAQERDGIKAATRTETAKVAKDVSHRRVAA